MIQTLPILLKNQRILLIGGGKVALQKAQVLQQNNIYFEIITKYVCDDLLDLTLSHNITMKQKKFKLKDINDFYIIIDASGNKKVTEKLLKYRQTNNILLNVVDVPQYCDFYFMALTSNKALQIAVSSNGASPTAAKYFRDECEKLIPDDISLYLKKKQEDRNNNIINIEQTKTELKSKNKKVYLLGCGLGDVELLTIKAYNIIQKVDVVLYDYLISEEIMNIVPDNTKKVFVGKRKDYHFKSQDEINKLIIKYHNKGLNVARLKSGDPFVFGRGAEELTELLKLGINTEVVSGISSAISATSAASIPITARGYASGFSVVSAHLKGNSLNLTWIDLLKKENHTVVVLMGLSRLRQIVQEAYKIGINTNKPCAIISNASRKNQKVIKTNLKNILEVSKNIQRPAILVFGDVVNF